MTEESNCNNPSPASRMAAGERFNNQRLTLCLAILLLPTIFLACRPSPANRPVVGATDQAFPSADPTFITTPPPSAFGSPRTLTPSAAPLSNQASESTQPVLSTHSSTQGNQTAVPAGKSREITITETLDPATLTTVLEATTAESTVEESTVDESTFEESTVEESTVVEGTFTESTVAVTPETSVYVETPAVITPINELSAGTNEITIRGTVVQTASFSKGFKFEISDGTGIITLLLWQDIYDDFWEAESLNLGADVQVSGQIHLYEGQLEIQPTFASQVNVIRPSISEETVIEIGSLDQQLGERVTIQGRIERVEGTDYGAKIFLADASGEILVFIWNNILERIPNNSTLGESGTSVRITGIVQEYRSNREVVPSLPYDVKVLQD